MVSLINCNFKYPATINQDLVKNFINNSSTNNSFRIALLDKSRFAGLNIKYFVDDSKISIFMFKTGSICITSLKNSSQILLVYSEINNLLVSLSLNK